MQPNIPNALPSTHKGVTVNHDMRGAAIGQLHLRYAGNHVSPPPGMSHLQIECEIYEVDGIFSVHTVCPKCGNGQWIDGKNKRVEYDARAKTLHVEPFKCSWEMSADRQEFGVGMCNLRLAYDGKVAKDA